MALHVANVAKFTSLLTSHNNCMDGIFHFNAKERGCARNRYFFVIYSVVLLSNLNIQKSPIKKKINIYL